MFRALARRFGRSEDGAATVEFVFVFPVVVSIVLATFEAGWLMTKYMMLDRGVDIAVREVRLGLDPTVDHDKIKARICDVAMILKDCNTTLKVQLITLDVNSPPDMMNADCFDKSLPINVPGTFAASGGQRSELMFVRACVLVDPILPGLEFGLLLPQQPSGGHQMVSYSAFKNEPI